MQPSVIRRAASALVLGPALAIVPGPGAEAQDGAGRQVTLGVSQGLVLSDNLALDPDPAGRTVTAQTALDARLVTETALDRLSLSGALRFRASEGPEGREAGLADPSIALAWRRQGATASLEVTARWREDDIAFLRPLSDFVGPGGEVVLPPDLDDLEGEGTRIGTELSAVLALGEGGPFGLTLSAGFTDLRYRDVTDPAITDSQRSTLAVAGRFEITPALEATLRLSRAGFREEGEAERATVALDGGLSLARPAGNLVLDLSAVATPDGTRYALSFGRVLEAPGRSLDARLGLSQGVEGDIGATGRLTFTEELPGGRLVLSLSRGLTAGSDDSEEQLTSLSLGYDRELAPGSVIGLDLALAARTATGTGAERTDASLGIDWSRELAQDWSLALGYRHVYRETEAEGAARENSVSLTLRRQFDLPF